MDGNTRRCRTKAERLVVTPEVLDSGVTLGSCAPFASGAKECGTQLQAQEPIDCAGNGSGLVVGCRTATRKFSRPSVNRGGSVSHPPGLCVFEELIEVTTVNGHAHVST